MSALVEIFSTVARVSGDIFGEYYPISGGICKNVTLAPYSIYNRGLLSHFLVSLFLGGYLVRLR
mgnify:CR=1 FL=1